ncbi:hypothetical protein BV25DRAFT_1671439 [Artomyces pyxidatus]|uniref:Uncharacterized protein n=1 Tax=Artomyces pyxidatus TaxID=48021 RepID=A0ACB8T958_9AGAM|nr:hypothetical protein BV25DRAFT_1671439 [Artomyces pyxidatus]
MAGLGDDSDAVSFSHRVVTCSLHLIHGLQVQSITQGSDDHHTYLQPATPPSDPLRSMSSSSLWCRISTLRLRCRRPVRARPSRPGAYLLALADDLSLRSRNGLHTPQRIKPCRRLHSCPPDVVHENGSRSSSARGKIIYATTWRHHKTQRRGVCGGL